MKHVNEAKDYATDFAGKAYHELKGEVVRQKHLLVIIGGVIIVKTIAMAVISAKCHANKKSRCLPRTKSFCVNNQNDEPNDA